MGVSNWSATPEENVDADGVQIDQGRYGFHISRAIRYIMASLKAFMDAVDINGGNIDGTAIGENSRSTGKFTTLQANSDVLFQFGSGEEITIEDDRAFSVPLNYNNTNGSASSISTEWKDQGTRRIATVLDIASGHFGFRTYNSSGTFVGDAFTIDFDAPDDAVSVHSSGGLALKDGITAPGIVSGKALLYVDSSDGSLKVKFGSGNVQTIAMDIPAP